MCPNKVCGKLWLLRQNPCLFYISITTFRRANATRIAVVTFSTEAILNFNLNTLEKVTNAIDHVHYLGGATASTLALGIVRSVVAPRACKDSKRVMLFITDGSSNIGVPSKKEAKYLRKSEGFEIFAVGKIQCLLLRL